MTSVAGISRPVAVPFQAYEGIVVHGSCRDRRVAKKGSCGTSGSACGAVLSRAISLCLARRGTSSCCFVHHQSPEQMGGLELLEIVLMVV